MKKFLTICIAIHGILIANPAAAQKMRYTNHTEVGVTGYNLTFKEAGFNLQTFNGILLNPDLAVGATVGYEEFSVENRNNFSVLPISAAVRYTFLEPSKTRMIAALDAGYGFAWRNNYSGTDIETSGGLRLAPELGLKFNTGTGNTFFSFAVGYQYQIINEDRSSAMGRIGPTYYFDYISNPTVDYQNEVKMNVHRFSVKVGFGF